MEAAFYNKLENNKVQCFLCPHNCIIAEGRRGVCKVRRNNNGELIAETYQKYSAVGFDPIEKKPLYHFHPGKEILSLGSVGCNMSCKWCQNCEISQVGVDGSRELIELSSEKVIQMAMQRPNNIGLAFTYNEPGISYETVIETASLSKKNNLKNVLVSNGYIGEKALSNYLEIIDAFNIDIKAFENDIYKQYTNAPLQPVLNNLKKINKKGRHLELTYLLVPGVNDNFKKFGELINWIYENLGPETVLHISRYFPRFKFSVRATPTNIIEKFADLAAQKLYFVYAGNYSSTKYSHTYCPHCSTIVIQRMGYSTSIVGETDGNCPQCNRAVFVAK